jgi:hypothetical protein
VPLDEALSDQEIAGLDDFLSSDVTTDDFIAVVEGLRDQENAARLRSM